MSNQAYFTKSFIGIPASEEEVVGLMPHGKEKRIRSAKVLRNFLSERMKTIGLTPEQKEALDFLNKVYERRRNLKGVDPYDFLTAIIYAYSDKSLNNIINVEFIRKNIKSIDISTATNPSIVAELQEIIINVFNKGIINQFLRLPFDCKGRQEEKIKNNYDCVVEHGELPTLEEFHRILKEYFCRNEESRDFFTSLIATNPLGLLAGLGFLILYNNGKKEFGDKCEQFLEERLQKPVNLIRDKIREMEKERKTKAKYADRVKKAANALINRFELDELIEITKDEFDDLNSYDAELAKKLLTITLKHNLGYFKETIERLENESGKEELEKAYRNSCFSYDLLSEDQKKVLGQYGNITRIIKLLEILSNSGIYDDSFPIYDILLLSDESIVNEITRLIVEKKISIDFVKKNPSIFVRKINEKLLDYTNIDNASYGVFKSNYDSLRACKIDTLTVSKVSSKTLLMDHNALEKVISLINAYGLHYASSNDYSLFENPKLIELADSFIELGLENFIRMNPQYIRENSSIILKRLQMCRLFGIELESGTKLPSMITNPQFKIHDNLICDNDLDEYIPNAVPRFADANAFEAIERSQVTIEPDKEILELKSYQKGNLTYKIGNIIISRLKVLRNLSIINQSDLSSGLSREQIIFNAMIHGSNLSDDELTNLSRQLKEEIKKLQRD